MIPENQINNSPAADAVETTEVDLNEVAEVEDATGDVNVAAKLPPRGIYPFKWKAGKDEHPYAAKTKGDTPRSFVGTSLVGTLQDNGGDFDGTLVFDNHENSLAKRGKPTSDLHHILNVFGSPAPNRTTIGELLQHTKDVLDQEPIGMAEVDWRAAYKDENGNWQEFVKTMTGFPKHYVNAAGETVDSAKEGNWDGTYVQTIKSPKDGEDINAQLYVRKFLTMSEAKKLSASA